MNVLHVQHSDNFQLLYSYILHICFCPANIPAETLADTPADTTADTTVDTPAGAATDVCEDLLFILQCMQMYIA